MTKFDEPLWTVKAVHGLKSVIWRLAEYYNCSIAVILLQSTHESINQAQNDMFGMTLQ